MANFKSRMSVDEKLGVGCLLMLFIMFCGWVTHVVVSIKSASWILLLVGALLFPIGIVHGIGSWFGLF